MSRYEANSAATPEYYNALGQAAFTYSSVEWAIVSIARVLKDDFITAEFYKKWTGSDVKREFVKILAINEEGLGHLHSKLIEYAERFGVIVRRRNAIVHSQPITGEDGSAMLAHYEFIDSHHLTVSELDCFTKDADDLLSDLLNILHCELPKVRAP